MIRTRSPTLHSLPSSWALKRTRCWMTFLYSGCFLRSETCTTTVLSILSETTVPTRTLRKLRSGASVSVIPCLSGRPTAARPLRRRSGGLFGGLHVLGCLLVRRLGLGGRIGLGLGGPHRLDRLGRLDGRGGDAGDQLVRRLLDLLAQAARVHHRQDPRDVLADPPDLPVIVELTHRDLEAELVQLPPRALEPAGQLVAVQRPQLVNLHALHSRHAPPPAAPQRRGSACASAAWPRPAAAPPWPRRG